MLNPPTVELDLQGSTPSKKNSRINRGDGKSFPSKLFVQWQRDAIRQVRLQTKVRFLKPVSVQVIIYFGTKARADLDNRVTSILDMLVEALVLPDDKWQDVPVILAHATYRKGMPGAFIKIREM